MSQAMQAQGLTPSGQAIALMATERGELATSNFTTKFREAFEEYLGNGPRWTEAKHADDLAYVDGNAAAASYLVIAPSVMTPGAETVIESRINFAMPMEVGIGLSMSQRVLGTEFFVEVVDTDQPLPDVPDMPIASIQQATTTLTINFATPHNLAPGKCIGIYGVSDSRLNYPALVVASVPTPLQITCTAGPGGTIPSLTVGPLSSGFVEFRQRMGRANDGVALAFEQASATSASIYTRSAQGDALPSGTITGNHGVTIGTSASVALVASTANTYAWAPTTEYRLAIQADRVQLMDMSVESLASINHRLLRTSVVPSPDRRYKLRLRTKVAKGQTAPVGKIVSVSKSGSTTATIVFDRPHGLTTSDQIVAYGARDQANFANLTAATAVASVVNPTTITVVWGAAVTATSRGGYVARVNGGNLMSSLGAVGQVVSTAQLTTLTDGTRNLILVGNAAWSGVSIGDVVEGIGIARDSDGVLLGIDGAWKVANINATTLTLAPVPGRATLPADFAAINAGGALVRRTELRVSFVRIFDFTRERVEFAHRAANDAAAALPVNIAASTSLTATVSSGTLTRANLGLPYGGGASEAIADVASAAITSTATTSALTPTGGVSYEVNIPVTAVSGTTPTLDVTIEESDDAGTNWFPVYSFPRITANGIYRSPKLPLTGNRVRYVQTIGGTSPSFTRAINRLQCNDVADPIRQLIDRSVSLTTANATTPSLVTQNCRNVQLSLSLGAATTPPQLTLEGSDDNGATWYSLGLAALAGVANSTVTQRLADVHAQLVRARVSTVGATVTMGYVLLKAY